MWVVGCEWWVVGCGLLVVGCGLWAVGCGLWVVSCGLRLVDWWVDATSSKSIGSPQTCQCRLCDREVVIVSKLGEGNYGSVFRAKTTMRAPEGRGVQFVVKRVAVNPQFHSL